MTIADKKLSGMAPPAEATAWYVSVKDEHGQMISSEVTIH